MEELECILLGSPSSASTASDRHPGSPKDPEEITAEEALLSDAVVVFFLGGPHSKSAADPGIELS